MSEYVIEMLNITKEFPGIKANDNITAAEKGEVHALLGENGAANDPDERAVRAVPARGGHH